MANNFMKRAVSGLLFVVILTAGIFIDPYCFYALFFIINIMGMIEFARMAEIAGIQVNRPLCFIAGSLLITAGFLHNFYGCANTYLAVFLATFLLGISELYRKKTHAFQNLAFGIYTIFYISLPFTLLVYFPFLRTGGWHPGIVFFPFLLVWLNDTFAYLFGCTFGKHRLFPRISPKKSWEGAVGGGLTTIIAGYFIAPYVQGLTATDALAIPVIVVIFGSFGDLIESMFKRCIEIKDSGNIMPGHGGVLDRMDSILFALPAVFVYLKMIH